MPNPSELQRQDEWLVVDARFACKCKTKVDWEQRIAVGIMVALAAGGFGWDIITFALFDGRYPTATVYLRQVTDRIGLPMSVGATLIAYLLVRCGFPALSPWQVVLAGVTLIGAGHLFWAW